MTVMMTSPPGSNLPTALVLTEDRALGDRLSVALAGLADVQRVRPDDLALVETLHAVRPDLVMVDGDALDELVTELVATSRRAQPTAAIVVLGDETESGMLLAAMRAGAQDVLPRSAAEPTLRRGLRDRLSRSLCSGGPERRAECVVVLGGHIGDPAHETALALALAATGQPGRKPLLVELSARAADAALSLGTECAYGIVEAMTDVDRLDAALLEGAVTRHAPTGLAVLPLLDPRDGPRLDAGDLRSLVAALAAVYDPVIINVGGEPPPMMLAALAPQVRNWCLVATQTITSSRGAARSLRLLVDAGVVVKERVTLTVAEHDSRVMLTPIAICGALGLVSVVALPDNRAGFRNALNRGRLLPQGLGPRGATDALGLLAAKLVGSTEGAVVPAWRRLLSRFGFGP
jgi:pilus assembly protein CpaE